VHESQRIAGSDVRAGACLGAILLIAVVVHGLNAPLDFDEHYHLAAIEKIRTDLPRVDLRHSPAATPLLYHAMVAGAATLIEDTLVAARIVTATFSLVAIWGLYWLASRPMALERPLWATVLVAVNPGFLWHSGLAMTELPSLCWAVLSLVSLMAIHAPIRAAMASGLCASAAVWTRQTWVLLPLAFLVAATGEHLRGRRLDGRLIGAGCLGMLGAVPLFLIWGGFSPPGQYASSHNPTLNPFQPFFGLALLGFYLPGFALSSCPRRRVIVIVMAVMLLSLFPSTSPLRVHSAGGLLDNPQGALQGLLNLIAKESIPRVAAVCWMLLIGVGTAGMVRVIRSASAAPSTAFTLLCLAILAFELAAIPQTWERYWSAAIPMTVFLALAAMERSGGRLALRVQYLYSIALGAAYFIHQLRSQQSLL
jgi:4-amino-4-deoxy-L-arabinose transferase-like glycosyltransferase